MAKARTKTVAKSKAAVSGRRPKSRLKQIILVFVSLAVVFVGLYFAYKLVHYHSAPAEIKALRKEKIYNYESENLKIVRRSEDYGGKDWKGVYNKPTVSIAFKGVTNNPTYSDCRSELTSYFAQDSWRISNTFKAIVSDEMAYTFTSDKLYRMTLFPGNLIGELCVVQVAF